MRSTQSWNQTVWSQSHEQNLAISLAGSCILSTFPEATYGSLNNKLSRVFYKNLF